MNEREFQSLIKAISDQLRSADGDLFDELCLITDDLRRWDRQGLPASCARLVELGLMTVVVGQASQFSVLEEELRLASEKLEKRNQIVKKAQEIITAKDKEISTLKAQQVKLRQQLSERDETIDALQKDLTVSHNGGSILNGAQTAPFLHFQPAPFSGSPAMPHDLDGLEIELTPERLDLRPARNGFLDLPPIHLRVNAVSASSCHFKTRLTGTGEQLVAVTSDGSQWQLRLGLKTADRLHPQTWPLDVSSNNISSDYLRALWLPNEKLPPLPPKGYQMSFYADADGHPPFKKGLSALAIVPPSMNVLVSPSSGSQPIFYFYTLNDEQSKEPIVKEMSFDVLGYAKQQDKIYLRVRQKPDDKAKRRMYWLCAENARDGRSRKPVSEEELIQREVQQIEPQYTLQGYRQAKTL